MQAVETGLPSGIVTFVFTDIEGSTRLLRRLGDRYPPVLERHYELLRDACARHRGHDMGTAGDSLFVAFADAPSAVLACAEAQRALEAEPWPHGDPLRVRMGIHTGLAVPRDEGYVALSVHQAARVMSAAHGGQVLLSSATARELPPLDGVEVIPIGRFRMRDFEEAEALYTLTGPGLATTFPAVRAMPVDGHNLVRPPTSFVGRDGDVDDVVALLGAGRLLTLTGPGGVGKTRLATEVGLQVAQRWPDGVWLVDLAPLRDPAQLGATTATAVGVPPGGGERWDDVIDHLRGRRALLVLDNCEQLAAACGRAVDELLAACPGSGVLATSRAPLGIAREQVHRVATLQAEAAAVALFVDRARRVRPDLVVDETTEPLITAICRRLDGLPLAIELAAARLGVLSLVEIHDGLDDRFRLLRTTNADVPARQQTMGALLEWSDRLLSEDERACMRRLGLFGSSFSVQGAGAAVATGMVGEDDVPELLWSLVDKSLVVADLTSDHTRYRLLESVRAFARRRLDDHGELEDGAVRLARWYVDRLGLAHRDRGWTGEMGVELDNLRGLVRLVATDEPSLAQELAVMIGQHLDAVQAYSEGVDEVTRYARDLVAPSPERVSLLSCLAVLHLRCGDIGAAGALATEAEVARSQAGAAPVWDDVAIERVRADLACRAGEYRTAMAVAGGALARDLSVRGRARMCSQLGIASSMAGEPATARDALERELAAYEQLGDDVFTASAHGNLAELAIREGDVATAARHQQACLSLALALGAPVLVAYSAIVAARIAAGDGDWTAAVRLHASARSVLEARAVALYDDDRRLVDALAADARSHLGDDRFEEAAAAGRGLDLPTAAALADRVLSMAADHP